MLAWTPGGAVLIRYTPEGERFATYVWLWANAVRRIGHDGLPSRLTPFRIASARDDIVPGMAPPVRIDPMMGSRIEPAEAALRVLEIRARRAVLKYVLDHPGLNTP